MISSSLVQELKKNGHVTYRNSGVSMMPLLKQGRDIFTVRRKEPEEKLKKYDVALYQRRDRLILHRVIGFTDNGYIIRGDNCTEKEKVLSDDVIGVMTGYVRKGVEYSVTDKAFKRYTMRMMFFSPLRITYKRTGRKIKRFIKKVTGK